MLCRYDVKNDKVRQILQQELCSYCLRATAEAMSKGKLCFVHSRKKCTSLFLPVTGSLLSDHKLLADCRERIPLLLF